MSKEKIVFSLIAILFGIFVAGGAFYIYQMTRTVNDPENISTVNPTIIPSPIPQDKNFLLVQEPKDEQVFSKNIITVSGKTTADATIIISTQATDQVVEPSRQGDFTLTETLEDGVNTVKITAIFSDGTEQTIERTVTSTAEDF